MNASRRRIWAGFADSLLLLVVSDVIASAFTKSGSFSSLYLAIGIFFALNLVYHAAMEFWLRGSIGKHLFGLTVVALDHTQPRRTQTLLRNLARLVDILPNFYVLGLIAIRADPSQRQRVGDRLAGTVVVERRTRQRRRRGGRMPSFWAG